MSEDHRNRRVDDNRLSIILAKLEEGEQRELRIKEALKAAEEKQEHVIEDHKAYCSNEFSRINKILNPIKRGFDVVDQPIRWAGWTMVATLGGALVWLGNHFMSWLARHFNN